MREKENSFRPSITKQKEKKDEKKFEFSKEAKISKLLLSVCVPRCWWWWLWWLFVADGSIWEIEERHEHQNHSSNCYDMPNEGINTSDSRTHSRIFSDQFFFHFNNFFIFWSVECCEIISWEFVRRKNIKNDDGMKKQEKLGVGVRRVDPEMMWHVFYFLGGSITFLGLMGFDIFYLSWIFFYILRANRYFLQK